MKCPKCRGMMVDERSADHFMIRLERRCLCCGNVMNVSMLHIRATDLRPAATARWSR